MNGNDRAAGSGLCVLCVLGLGLFSACGERTDPAPREEPQVRTEEAGASAAARLAQILDRPVRNLRWSDASLREAVAHLALATGAPFHLSPLVRAERADSVVLDWRLDDVSVRALLDVLTEIQSMRWEVREDGVWILGADEISGTPRLELHDVADLVWGSAEVRRLASGESPPGFASVDHLVRRVLADVFPAYWDREEASFEERDLTLVVRAPPVVQQTLAACLRRMRAPDAASAARRVPEGAVARLAGVRVDLSAGETNVATLVARMRARTALPLLIDPRVAAEASESPVTALHLEQAPVTAALEMLAELAGEEMLWVERGEILMLTLEPYLPAFR